MFQGSCLCRGVRYELSAEPGAFGYCHCTSCRKASGSAHAANAPVDRAAFHVLSGKGAAPDVIRIRLGSLDTPFLKRPQAHFPNLTPGLRDLCCTSAVRGKMLPDSSPHVAAR